MTADDNSLIRQRWVRIMCDYAAEGVWNRQGGGCSIEDLPVSPALAARISAWQEWYERLPTDTHNPDFPAFDMHGFSTEGYEIARAVKRALPDWTVIYFDEEKYGRDRPRKEFEYEITLEESENGPKR